MNMTQNHTIGDKDSNFIENIIAIDRVTRVVKGGRRFRFRALAVVGDKKNKVGIGVAKGGDIQVAISKAVADAKRNMVEIAIVNHTLPHEVQARHAGSEVLLIPAASGTGLIAGGTVRQVLETIDIENVLSKSLGSSNKINTARATVKALQAAVPKSEWTSAGDSKKKATKGKKDAKTSKKPATKKESKE